VISTRLAAAIAAGILVVGILVGSAGAFLLGRGGGPADGSWGQMHSGFGAGMMGRSSGMMGGWDSSDMLDQMREHMGYGRDSQ
jgi:hypothetical protein